jgi:hypothetical protein
MAALTEWAKRNAGSYDERLATKVAMLPPGGSPGTVRHPFKVIPREEYLAKVRGKGIYRLAEKAPIVDVSLGELNGIQRTINTERLMAHLKNPGMIAKGQRAPGHGGLIDKPLIVKVGGQLCIHDGHHRCSAAKLQGDSTIRARYVDLDGK